MAQANENFFRSSYALCGPDLQRTSLQHEICVLLKTFGEAVLVELLASQPGSSKVRRAIKRHGGKVSFMKLCPDSYSLAIGNDDTVRVTLTRVFLKPI